MDEDFAISEGDYILIVNKQLLECVCACIRACICAFPFRLLCLSNRHGLRHLHGCVHRHVHSPMQGHLCGHVCARVRRHKHINVHRLVHTHVDTDLCGHDHTVICSGLRKRYVSPFISLSMLPLYLSYPFTIFWIIIQKHCRSSLLAVIICHSYLLF